MSLLTNLLAYYKFDENSGSNASDVTGNGNTGTWKGTLGSQWTTGIINSGGNFNGSNNYIDLGTGIELDTTGKFSVSMWINPSSFSNYGFLFMDNASNSYFIITQITTGTITAAVVSATLNSSTTITIGTWYHLVWTYDGTIQTLYINGNQDTQLSNAQSFTDVGLQKVFGFNPNNVQSQFYYNGKMDEVGIWGRPLSASEASQLYNIGIGLQYPFLVSLPSITISFSNPYIVRQSEIVSY